MEKNGIVPPRPPKPFGTMWTMMAMPETTLNTHEHACKSAPGHDDKDDDSTLLVMTLTPWS